MLKKKKGQEITREELKITKRCISGKDTSGHCFLGNRFQ